MGKDWHWLSQGWERDSWASLWLFGEHVAQLLSISVYFVLYYLNLFVGMATSV